MNCDQAFDTMTSLDRIDSAALTLHLARCPRCCQMFETLEPALGLFDRDKHTPYELDPASANITRKETSSTRIAEQVAARLSPEFRSPQLPAGRTRLWGTILAMSSIGFLLGWSMTLLISAPENATPEASSPCAWLNRGMLNSEVSASTVASTCVSCHLLPQAKLDAEHEGILDISRELDRMLVAWTVNSHRAWCQTVLIAGANNGTWGGRIPAGMSGDRTPTRLVYA